MRHLPALEFQPRVASGAQTVMPSKSPMNKLFFYGPGKASPEHLAILERGVKVWNRWREQNPKIKPRLKEAFLFQKNLAGINFRGAELYHAQLSHANLQGADLREADLRGARLALTNLKAADLQGACLMRATLIGTKLQRANLSGAIVFGISAWDVHLEGAIQRDLRLRPSEPLTVDNLEIAQFIYLLLKNDKIRDLINTVGRKGVLILGRFTERKEVLKAIRTLLRDLGYLPIVFDFERPTDRDFTETVKTLAGMSRFIIADITKPKSVPLELQATVPDYMIPMVTIIQKGEKPFAMFQDLWTKHRDWVLRPLTYDSIEQLQRVFQKAVVDPANSKLLRLRKRKAERLELRDAADYE